MRAIQYYFVVMEISAVSEPEFFKLKTKRFRLGLQKCMHTEICIKTPL